MQENKPSRFSRLSVITGVGLLATLAAAGLGGVASAQTVIDDAAPAPVTRVLQERAIQVDDGDDTDMFESSPEDEAVWQRFEQCLADAGLNMDDEAADEAEPDEATLDAAFDQCEPILDELTGEGFEVFDDFGELSPEDEALFDQFDACLESGGIDALFEAESGDGVVDDAAIDALFEQCDPILDGLSEDAQELFGDFEDCPEDDEHDETDTADTELEGADA